MFKNSKHVLDIYVILFLWLTVCIRDTWNAPAPDGTLGSPMGMGLSGWDDRGGSDMGGGSTPASSKGLILAPASGMGNDTSMEKEKNDSSANSTNAVKKAIGGIAATLKGVAKGGFKTMDKIIYSIEFSIERVFAAITNSFTVVQTGLTKGNQGMKKGLTFTFTAIAKVPSTIVDVAIRGGTSAFQKGTVVIGSVFQAGGLTVPQKLIKKLGSNVHDCYNDNKQDVFKSLLTSIPQCFTGSTTKIVNSVNSALGAIQMYFKDIDLYFKDLMKCQSPLCIGGSAMKFFSRVGGSSVHLGVNLGGIGKNLVSLTANNVNTCLATSTGLSTGAQFAKVIGKYVTCVIRKTA